MTPTPPKNLGVAHFVSLAFVSFKAKKKATRRSPNVQLKKTPYALLY